MLKVILFIIIIILNIGLLWYGSYYQDKLTRYKNQYYNANVAFQRA